jgi:hypothetical protein
VTTKENIEANLASIRAVVDLDISGLDIESVVEQGKKLASMMGLSSECMAAAQKHLQFARLKAIQQFTKEISRSGKDIPPSLILKMADGECGMELATYEYADRLNAAISHQLDYYRTVISLYKSELENSMEA